MGKNKARHILHGVLDCLPIILIPIFMIYSQNHEINGYEVTINESYWEVVNKFNTNEVNTINDIDINKIYRIEDLEFINGNTSQYEFDIYLYSISEYSIYDGTSILDNEYIEDYNANSNNYLKVHFEDTELHLYFTNNNSYTNIRFDNFFDIYFGSCDFVILNNNDLQNFKLWCGNNGYDETNISNTDFELLEYVFHENEPVIYNDTDIMSQSFYCLYNAVDKYFNMGNVFGMKNLYTWFETNIFGGTASPSIYIVWNIVLYEFIMDLLFLLYGLFMFFIDLCKRLMEKPLNSIK